MSYTVDTLKAYMHAHLGGVADALGYTVAAGSYDEAVNDVEAWAEDDTADLETGQARILARLAVWKQVVAHTVSGYDLSLKGTSLSRSQFHEMALGMMHRAQDEAESYGYVPDSYSQYIERQTITRTGDPYGVDFNT